MDDLRVESYGDEEVAAKQRSISKRVVAAGSAVVLTLGLFGLVGCVDVRERAGNQTSQVEKHTPQDEEHVQQDEKHTPQDEEHTSHDEEQQEPPQVVGGSGSWFVSVLERI